MLSVAEWIQVGTLISVFLSLFMSYRNSLKITEVHLSINSRMDELLRSEKASSLLEGMENERNKEK